MGRFNHLEMPGKQNKTIKDEKSQTGPIYDVDLFMELAETNYWEGDYEASLRYYSKALRENSALDQGWLGQVQCLLRIGEHKEALVWVDKALDKFPNSSDLLAAKSVVYSKLGDKTRALDFADAALNVKAESPFTWIARGDALINVNHKNAERCLEKAIELKPNDWKTLTAIGDVYRENKRFRSALKFYMHSVEKKPDNAHLWLLIGKCRLVLGFSNYKEAFQSAIEINPDCEEAQQALRTAKPKLTKKISRIFGIKHRRR